MRYRPSTLPPRRAADDPDVVRFTCLSHTTPVSWEARRSDRIGIIGCPACREREQRTRRPA